jgi:hypothetical protein
MDEFFRRKEPTPAAISATVVHQEMHLLECNTTSSAVSLPRGFVGVTHSDYPYSGVRTTVGIQQQSYRRLLLSTRFSSELPEHSASLPTH